MTSEHLGCRRLLLANASSRSRVSRATFVSSRAADELRGRTAFGAMRLLRAAVLRALRFCWFVTCSGAPSHCRPSAQDKASWRDQTSTPGDGSSQCVGVTFALGLKKRSFSKTAQMCAAHEQVRRLGRYARRAVSHRQRVIGPTSPHEVRESK